jgi:hypothetical protein
MHTSDEFALGFNQPFSASKFPDVCSTEQGDYADGRPLYTTVLRNHPPPACPELQDTGPVIGSQSSEQLPYVVWRIVVAEALEDSPSLTED